MSLLAAQAQVAALQEQLAQRDQRIAALEAVGDDKATSAKFTR